jgi:polyketide synthase 12/polyene macrolide polyketide synthase
VPQAGASGQDTMLTLTWVPTDTAATDPAGYVVLGRDAWGIGASVASPAELTGTETAVLLPVSDLIGEAGDDETPQAVHATAARALELIQHWLTDDRLAGVPLILLTRDAVTGGDLAAAAVWGLVRSAQSEHPGRLILADLQGTSTGPLPIAQLLAAHDEGQFVIRDGIVHIGRFARVPAVSGAPAAWDPDGTVLITGGTGGIGALLARHLVTARDARHLVLASRRGPDAAGAARLRDELTAAGATITVTTCDVADPDAVSALVASIPARHPLTAVIHAAGVLDDGVLTSLTPARLDAVLAPKADAAWHLHDATKGIDLAAFILFSSVAGIMGSPGQGSYAAGNLVLDALAARRAAQGLPAQSLAWPAWDLSGGMAGTASDTTARRIAGTAGQALSTGQALALFDAAVATGESFLVPQGRPADRGRTPDVVPPLFRGLVKGTRRQAAGTADAADQATLNQRLTAMDPQQRDQALLDLVYAESASVLGMSSIAEHDRTKEFMELGFDSLTSVELRNRLAEVTGLQLPPTLVFDTRTPAALAGRLRGEMFAATGPADTVAQPETDSLESMFLDALAAGKSSEIKDMIKAVAAIRPSVEATAELPDLPWSVTLAEGSAEPPLICVSTPTANAGPQQYAALAAHWRGVRNVSVLPLLGFTPGEHLPANPEVAVKSIAESALRAADGRPFVLLGHSSGGSLAYTTAGIMETTWGITPAAVVMLDTLSFSHAEDEGIDFSQMMRINFARTESIPFRLTNSRLSAMGRWVSLLQTMKITPTSAPVLLVRSTKPLFEGQFEPGEDPRPPVVETATVRLVDANHVSLAREDSAATAEIVEQWLRAEIVPGVMGASQPARTGG